MIFKYYDHKSIAFEGGTVTDLCDTKSQSINNYVPNFILIYWDLHT